MRRTPGTNNYFRIQGTREVFPFDESVPADVESALKNAIERARQLSYTSRLLEVLVWRRGSLFPGFRQVGDPVLSPVP